jgi:HK97 family phage major capsid protein
VKVLTKENRAELMNRAHALLNTKPFSKQIQAEYESVLKLLDVIDDEARYRAGSVASIQNHREELETRALRVEEEFRHYIHGGEKRTYAALAEGTMPGSVVVPTGQWRREYTSRLVSASGWLQAGLTVKNVMTGRPYISFFDNDSSNVASILAENGQLPLANPSFTSPTAIPVSFASALMLNNTLQQDVQNGSFDVDGFLQKKLGKRVGRAFNTYATSDGTDGLLAQITVGATSSSTSVPTRNELVAMQGQLNQAYLEPDSNPCYQLSQALKIRLMQQVDTAGRPLYPTLETGTLLGLPAIVNSDFTANAGDVAVVCGSIAQLAIVEDVAPILIKSTERYAELYQTMYGIVHRLGVKLIDSAAATALKLAAS